MDFTGYRHSCSTFIVPACHAPRGEAGRTARAQDPAAEPSGFYEEIRPDLAIETTRCYASAIDRSTGRFTILLEDLTDRSATFPDARASLTVSQVETLLTHLARMHARFWRSARFEGDLAWVPSPMRDSMFDVLDSIGFELISDQIHRHPFKAEMIEPLGWSFDAMWEQLWEYQAEMANEPTTLLHGHTHVSNTYVMPDGSAGFLDWQQMARCRWAHDVIYLLATSMAPSVRQRHQEALLHGYLAEIGWLITPPENFGRDITVAKLERVIAVVDELDTLV